MISLKKKKNSFLSFHSPIFHWKIHKQKEKRGERRGGGRKRGGGGGVRRGSKVETFVQTSFLNVSQTHFARAILQRYEPQQIFKETYYALINFSSQHVFLLNTYDK